MEKETFKKVLQSIIETYGQELLADTRRMNALLMDYVPDMGKERKLIVSALDEGVGRELQKASEQSPADQKLAVNRCIRLFINETWVAEEAAQFAVCSIASAIGIYVEEPQEAKQQEPAVQQAEPELLKGMIAPDSANLRMLLENYRILGYKSMATNQYLTDLQLPACIRKIKPKAFLNCVKLHRVVLPATIEEIGVGAFDGCDSLQTIEMERNPGYTVANGLLIDKKNKAVMRATGAVGENCIVPREVSVIQARAFERSKVQKVVLPRNLSVLDGKAFVLCSQLQRIEIDPHNEYFTSMDGVLHSKDRTQLLRFPSGYSGVNYIMEDSVTHIADGAFSGTAKLESLTFTSSVRSIGAKAFEYCPTLTSLMLPSSVEVIGERAFQYCDNLFSMMLSRSIREIGDYAFCGCGSIQTMSIPNDVKRIGHAAFKDCTGLKKIIIQSNVEFIGDGAFSGCSEDLEIAIRNNPYVQQYCISHKINWSSV